MDINETINKEMNKGVANPQPVSQPAVNTMPNTVPNVLLNDEDKNGDVLDLLKAIDSAQKQADEISSDAKLDAGNYDAVTKSLRLTTTQTGFKILEISYNVYKEDELGQKQFIGVYNDPNAVLSDTFPIDNVTQDAKKREKNQVRNNIAISRLVNLIQATMNKDKDEAKQILAQWLQAYMKNGEIDVSAQIANVEGTLRVTHRQSVVGDKTYDNYGYFFNKKN